MVVNIASQPWCQQELTILTSTFSNTSYGRCKNLGGMDRRVMLFAGVEIDGVMWKKGYVLYVVDSSLPT
jgi:hypothetical protein